MNIIHLWCVVFVFVMFLTIDAEARPDTKDVEVRDMGNGKGNTLKYCVDGRVVYRMNGRPFIIPLGSGGQPATCK